MVLSFAWLWQCHALGSTLLRFFGFRHSGSSLAHATTAARLGVSDPSSRHWDCVSRRHLCYTSKLHGSDLHGYRPCLVSRNSLGTTGRPPISYSGCLDISVYVFCVWLSFQGAKYIHFWGYEWVGGNGDVGMGCMQNRIGECGTGSCQCWHSLPCSDPYRGPLLSFTLSGWLE